MSSTMPTDNQLVIAESAIDALSYAQVNSHPRTRYISSAAELNERQPLLIDRAISWMPSGSTIVVATDRDNGGATISQAASRMLAPDTHT